LLEEAKKMKSSVITYAFIIGIMIGIIVYSVSKNTWGFFTLIPLYFIYRLVRNPNNNEALKKQLKERN
jgi:hypothetical protein